MNEFTTQATFASVVAAILGFVAIPLLSRFFTSQLRKEWERQLHEFGIEVEPHNQLFNNRELGNLGIFTALGSALLVFCVTLQLGITNFSLLLCFYFLSHILLVTINTQYQLLPDMIVIPIMWLGLIYHALYHDPRNFVMGAVLGYVIPYCLLWIYRMIKGEEGMGHGDFKAFAMAGAWFGASSLLEIFVIFYLVAFAIAISEMAIRKKTSIPSAIAHLIASFYVALPTKPFEIFG